MKQVDGVFKAICEVKGTESFDGAVALTSEERVTVVAMVAKGLHEGEIDLSERAKEKYDTEEKLASKYVPGLVNNHLRKDLRLNGGVPYKPKNPGSRTGSGDKLLQELKKLKSTLTDEDEIAQVQGEIDKRIAEIRASKMQKIEIDKDILPDELKHLA